MEVPGGNVITVPWLLHDRWKSPRTGRVDRRQRGSTRGCSDAVDMRRLVDRLEQLVPLFGRFRPAQKQVAVRAQRELKRLEHTLLTGTIQIDQELAADDQVQV